MDSSLPNVSVIVIGRNEAQRLPACLNSLRQIDYPAERIELLYVDTGSQDASVQIAQEFGVRTVSETGGRPTAALARNRGIQEAQYDIIHFVDGDMTVAPDYLKKAVHYLGRDGGGCVIGRLEEQRAKDNWIAWAFHHNWEIKQPGFVDAPGGGGTFLKAVLLDVGGYKADLPGMAETEIGVRLRQKGYRIRLIDEVMGVHDYEVTTLRQLLRWYYGRGYGHFGPILLLPEGAAWRHVQNIARKDILFTILLALAIIGIIVSGHWYWVLGLPAGLVLYVALRYFRYGPPEKRLQTLAYYLIVYLGKPLVAWGSLNYLWRYYWRKLRPSRA